MSEHRFLLVPIELKALVVNDEARIGQNFQRWTMNYNNLQSFTSSEPVTFSGNANDFASDSCNNGIYLHWTLPQILRQGDQDTITGVTTYPLVPNRWLIVRYSGELPARSATAWVVESDFLDPNEGHSAYVDPFSSTLSVTSIGRIRNLNNPQWSETNTKQLFLTAVGPGNVIFAAYQPYVLNVFSIHDELTDVNYTDTLSYLVAGWYSDASKDILSSWGQTDNFTDWLDILNWAVDNPSNETANASICHGMVHGIEWNKSGGIPASRRPLDASGVCVAVGNTSIDAQTAMIKLQAEGAGESRAIDAELLEAFQYDLLQVLDEPDGEQILQQKIHEAGFGSYPGGYVWEILDAPVDDPSQHGSDITADEKSYEEQWLAELNKAQADYDKAVRELNDLQWNLYVTWWKQGNACQLPLYPSGMTREQFEEQLDPQNQDGALYKVYKQLQLVNSLQQSIPTGASQDDLAESIVDYASKRSLPSSRQLKRANLPVFYEANDPALVISGAKVDSLLTDNNPLQCRFADQLVTGFNYKNTPLTVSSIDGGIPGVDMTNLPPIMRALLDEFFFFDPDNAALVAGKALNTTDPDTISDVRAVMAAYNSNIGKLPDIDLASWQQPWSPLYLMWQVNYYPIAHDTNGTDNWQFNGSDYTWTGNGAVDQPLVLSGRIFLTPQNSYNFKSMLDKYMQSYPDADLQAVEDFIAKTDDWDFLSQTLDGFTQQLALRDPASNLSPDNNKKIIEPDTTLATLVGPNYNYAPDPGPSQPIPFKGWPPSDFQQYRSGQFYFERLMVVDRFGQSIEVVNSTTTEQFKPIVAEGLQAAVTVLPEETYRFVQTPPRLLQPGRLRFDFLSSDDDKKVVNLDAGINPICAWVLPNYQDGALSFYDNRGAALGEVRVVTDETQQKILYWDGAPNSPYKTLQQVAHDFLHLGQFLTALSNQGPQAFNNLLQVIDETLWTINPIGTYDDQYLSVLIGRPLALVRISLRFELDGPPIADPSWQYTSSPKESDFINYEFPIRLGDVDLQDDGLLGYFVGDNYDQFNSVYYPSSEDFTQHEPNYIVQIGNGNYIRLEFNDNSSAYLTMLVDPRAGVHAVTSILPAVSLDVPNEFVSGALSDMEIMFHVGPTLTDIQVPGDEASQPSQADTTIIMPKPAEKNGTWSWMELESSQWSSYAITASDQSVKFSNILPRLRTGLLKLSGALDEKNQ